MYLKHYRDVTMGAIASQITGARIVYSTVCSDADQRKHQSSVTMVFVQGIHRWPVNSRHKGPVTTCQLILRQLLCYSRENRLLLHKTSQAKNTMKGFITTANFLEFSSVILNDVFHALGIIIDWEARHVSLDNQLCTDGLVWSSIRTFVDTVST